METAAQTMRKRMEYKMWEMSDNLKKVSKMQVFHLDAWWRTLNFLQEQNARFQQKLHSCHQPYFFSEPACLGIA